MICYTFNYYFFVWNNWKDIFIYNYPDHFCWLSYEGRVINFSIGIIFYYTGEDVLVADQRSTCGLCVKYYEGCKVNEYPFLTLKTVVKFPGNAHFDNGRAMGYLRLMKRYLCRYFRWFMVVSFKYISSILNICEFSFWTIFKNFLIIIRICNR